MHYPGTTYRRAQFLPINVPCCHCTSTYTSPTHAALLELAGAPIAQPNQLHGIALANQVAIAMVAGDAHAA